MSSAAVSAPTSPRASTSAGPHPHAHPPQPSAPSVPSSVPPTQPTSLQQQQHQLAALTTSTAPPSQPPPPAVVHLPVYAAPYAYTPAGDPLYIAYGRPGSSASASAAASAAAAVAAAEYQSSSSHTHGHPDSPLRKRARTEYAAPPPSHYSAQHHPHSHSTPRYDAWNRYASHHGHARHMGDHDELHARTQKKSRLVWTEPLHQSFVRAVEYLGVDVAVPKAIMQIMNVDSLTRENVASHLQKYRANLKRMKRERAAKHLNAPLFNDRPHPPPPPSQPPAHPNHSLSAPEPQRHAQPQTLVRAQHQLPSIATDMNANRLPALNDKPYEQIGHAQTAQTSGMQNNPVPTVDVHAQPMVQARERVLSPSGVMAPINFSSPPGPEKSIQPPPPPPSSVSTSTSQQQAQTQPPQVSKPVVTSADTMPRLPSLNWRGSGNLQQLPPLNG